MLGRTDPPGLVLPSEESKQLIMDRCPPELVRQIQHNNGHPLDFEFNRQFATSS